MTGDQRDVLPPEEQLPLYKEIRERIKQLRIVEYYDDVYDEQN